MGGKACECECECECECGQPFLSSTDNRSYVARFLPDQSYDAFSDIVDAAIERSGPTPADKDAACRGWRRFPMPYAWQCPNCGCLYLEDERGERHRFVPASEAAPRDVFRRR
jgi:hypothetical protein